MKFRSAVRHFSVINVVVIVASLLFAETSNAQSSPSAYTTGFRYSTGGLLTGTISPDPDGAGPLGFPAVRNTFDASGQLIRTESGQLAAWQADTIAPQSWNGFTVYRMEDFSYDWMGRRTSVQVSSNGTAYALAQTSYDLMGQLECTAVRMNPSSFAFPPASACALGTQGGDGPDRITRNSYDSRGRLVVVERAVGTPLQQSYATYTYGSTSKPLTVRDANGNVSSMAYDSLNRLRSLSFPSPTTPGQVNTSDYEEYTYDSNGNRLTKRTRDGQLLTYSYNALNRLVSKIPSSGSAVYFGYDLRGLQQYARFGSHSGYGINTAYDGFGRVASSTSTQGGFSRTVSSQYDANGNRTRITHPDGAFFTFAHDGLDRASQILEYGSTVIVGVSYDAAGRRSQISFGSTGVSTVGYSYDSISRLNAIVHNLDGTGTPNDVTFSFAYTPASQIKTRTLSNDLYEFTLDTAASRTYSVNGLNQYTSMTGSSSVAPTWDGRGNLTSDGSTSYTYDIENRLITASGLNSGILGYDPAGRLWQTSGGASGTTQFVYDGDQRVAEYSASGAVLRRYIHGPGVDEPLVWYEGPTVSATARRYMHADHQGSVIAVSSNTGTKLQTSKYDPFGVPGAGQTTPFQYTGQAWLPDLKLHYYKARVYSPTIGRFLQTDPIGYQDGLNLYAYVGNDPLNGRDPFGLRNCDPSDERCVETPESAGTPGDPRPKPEQTRQMEGVVVTAQRTKQDTAGKPIVFTDGDEHAYVVTPTSITQAKMRSLGSVNCGGGVSVELRGVSAPQGATRGHTHPNLFGAPGSVPGSGDHQAAQASSAKTAFVMTSANAFTIEAMANGTYRTSVNGAGLSDSQRADLVSNMQNWESAAANAPGASNRQRYCGKP